MAQAHLRPKAVFLFGPTAVGKTDLLLTLKPFDFEVVSADSLQVYRRLDIGTAKPSPEILSQIPHHLIDIIDPSQQFDVGEFVVRADAAIADIHARGRFPVVCGGAAFYLKHLLYGLPEVPASTAEIRAQIQAELDRDGLPSLYARLTAVDPATAKRVFPGDAYRITRALEVVAHTGRRLSDYPLPSKPRPGTRALLIGLDRPRPELHTRIADRVAQMMANGLRTEIEGLVRDGYGHTDPGLRGIGYQEFFGPEGSLRPAEEDTAVEREIARDTRRYAKRQITFFRSLPGVHWVAADAAAVVANLIETFARDE